MGVEHNKPGLVIHKLSKQFGNHLVVDSVDLTIADGEIFGLIGPNGPANPH